MMILSSQPWCDNQIFCRTMVVAVNRFSNIAITQTPSRDSLWLTSLKVTVMSSMSLDTVHWTHGGMWQADLPIAMAVQWIMFIERSLGRSSNCICSHLSLVPLSWVYVRTNLPYRGTWWWPFASTSDREAWCRYITLSMLLLITY